MKTSRQELIHGLSREEIASFCAGLGQPQYRAGQIWSWLYGRRAAGWADLKNIPEELRAALAAHFSIAPLESVREQAEGGSGSTTKFLLRLPDGERVEIVFIPAQGRTTLCLSSQVGCKYKCAFCASGQGGFARNLAAGEMVGEVLFAARRLGAPPAHVVFMGMGEPFDNYDNVLKAIRIINDPEGLCVGARKITISTCGVIPGIQKLAKENLQVELSVSLHAPDEALRSQLMPVNRIYPLSDLLAACRRYAEETGRLITFEYTLIRNLNDSSSHAGQLARILQNIHCRVNLIPLSPVAEFSGAPPAPGAARMFVNALARAHINATVRASKGGPINAACGQLRRLASTTGSPEQ